VSTVVDKKGSTAKTGKYSNLDNFDSGPVDDFDILVSKLLRDHVPDLQFVPHHRIEYDALHRNIIINHFPKTRFITKTGLTSSLHDLSWVSNRHSEDFYPRYDSPCLLRFSLNSGM